MAMTVNAQEKEWQKEYDARTLADAEEIKNDPARLKGAQAAAAKMVKEAEAKTNSLKKVAKSPIRRNIPRSTQKRAIVQSNTKTPYSRKK